MPYPPPLLRIQKRQRRIAVGLLAVLTAMIASVCVHPDAQAIPAFARKYNVNCTACHTAPPILNPYGQRFLENGYQLPGTEDGGMTGKHTLGDLTLDNVNQYIGFRMVGHATRSWNFTQRNPPGADTGVAQNKTELTFPEAFTMFTGGTITQNIGFMVELGHDVEGGGTAVERGFVTFNNLGLHDVAHIRIGRFDPSAFSSYATVRQQLNDVGESLASGCAAYTPCAFNRAGLSPSAFATKFYGLYD